MGFTKQWFLVEGKLIFKETGYSKFNLKNYVKKNFPINTKIKQGNILFGNHFIKVLQIRPDTKTMKNNDDIHVEKKINLFRIDKKYMNENINSFIAVYDTGDAYISIPINKELIYLDERREPNFFVELNSILSFYNKKTTSIEVALKRNQLNSQKTIKLETYFNEEISKRI